MFHDPTGPAKGQPATSQPGRVLPVHFTPDSPLWEQWHDHYAPFSRDALIDEEERLIADSDRMSRMCVPDTEAQTMVGLRLALIEELLTAPR